MLVAEGLRKRYRSREVVRDFGLTLDAGEVVGLLGPNGAGKTTCFYMIVGLVQADQGRVLIDDLDVSHQPMHGRARAGIGYLPQEASIFRKLSVADNIMAILETRKELDRDGRRKELESLLQEFHINHIRDNLGMSLSGGERRRVEIARALATRPRVLLLDEMLTGLTPTEAAGGVALIRAVRDQGITVVMVEHVMEVVLPLVDRAVVLNLGRVLMQGSPAEVVRHPDVIRAYLGDNYAA